jgi:hypothetical protein
VNWVAGPSGSASRFPVTPRSRACCCPNKLCSKPTRLACPLKLKQARCSLGRTKSSLLTWPSLEQARPRLKRFGYIGRKERIGLDPREPITPSLSNNQKIPKGRHLPFDPVAGSHRRLRNHQGPQLRSLSPSLDRRLARNPSSSPSSAHVFHCSPVDPQQPQPLLPPLSHRLQPSIATTTIAGTLPCVRRRSCVERPAHATHRREHGDSFPAAKHGLVRKPTRAPPGLRANGSSSGPSQASSERAPGSE